MAVNKYYIREKLKGSNKTTTFAVKNTEEPGITILTVVETLSKNGDVVDTKESSKYCPNNRITHSKTDGKLVYEITGRL